MPGFGSGNSTHEQAQSKRAWIVAKSGGAEVLKRHRRGGRPRTLLRVERAGKWGVGMGELDSSMRERPNTGTEDTMEGRNPRASKSGKGMNLIPDLVQR